MPHRRHRTHHAPSFTVSVVNEQAKGSGNSHQGILLIDQNGAFHSNQLDMTIQNNSQTDLNFSKGTKLTFNFAKIIQGVDTSQFTLTKINNASWNSSDVTWKKLTSGIPSNQFVLEYSGVNPTSWSAGIGFTFSFTGISAPKGFTQGMIEVDVANLTTQDNLIALYCSIFAKRIPASRQKLNLIPQFLDPNPPILGKARDVVYVTDKSKATIENRLVFGIDNVGQGPNIEKGKVIISVEGGEGPGALAPATTIANDYQLKITQNYGNAWSNPSKPAAQHPGNDLLLGWTFEPQGDILLPSGTNGKIRLEMSKIQTSLETGTANMFIQFFGMANYEDEVYALPIQKEEAPSAVHYFKLLNPTTNIGFNEPIKLSWSTTNVSWVKLEYMNEVGNTVQKTSQEGSIKTNEASYTLPDKLKTGNQALSFYAYDQNNNQIGSIHQIFIQIQSAALSVDFQIDSQVQGHKYPQNPNPTIRIKISPSGSLNLVESVSLAVNKAGAYVLQSNSQGNTWEYNGLYSTISGNQPLDGGDNDFVLTVNPKGGGNPITVRKTYFANFWYQKMKEEYPLIKINNTTWMMVDFNDKSTQNCVYNEYGVYYNFEEARMIAPPGWRLPTSQEWNELINYYGGFDAVSAFFDNQYPGRWNPEIRQFVQMRVLGGYWSGTDYPGSNGGAAYNLLYNGTTAQIAMEFSNKLWGYRIRLVKDD